MNTDIKALILYKNNIQWRMKNMEFNLEVHALILYKNNIQ